MRPLAERLERRHLVVSLELPGHGLAPLASTPYALSDLAEDVLLVSQELGVRRPILVGHSLGGRLGLAVAALFPDFAAGLVLIDSAIHDAPERAAARRQSLTAPDWRDSLRVRFRTYFGGLPVDRREAWVERMLATSQPAAQALLAASDGFDAVAALAGCKPPVLYVGAERPWEDPDGLRKVQPAVEVARVAGTGHFVPLEAPAQVAALLERFAERVALGAAG